ncbi:unnamed protein product [Amoebophrya sp. A25]|nr:unnamed protein product [Amoebophrya sp. A25]|eukprot:GSA25T00011986001.1
MEAEKEMDQTKLSTIDEAQTLYLRNLDYLNSFTRRNELRTPVEKLLRQLPNRKALAWACTMWGYDTKQPAESDFNKKALAEHRRREKNSDSKRGSPRRRSRTRSNAPESYNKRDQPIVGGTSSSSTDGHANSISLDGSTTCTPKLATDAVKATTEKNISLAQDLLVKIDWKKKDVDPRSRRKESKEQRSRSRARSRSSRARKGPLRGRGRSRSSSDSSPPKSSQAAKSGSNTKGGSSAATSSGKDTALTAVAQSKGSVTGKGMGIPHATSISGAAGFSKKVESPRRRSRSRSRGSPRRRRPIGKSMAPSRLGAAASLRNTNTAVFDPAAAPRVERRSSRESAEMNRDEGSSRGADGGSKRRRTETDHDRGDVDTANNRTTRERSTPRALPPHLASLVRNCEKSAGEVQNRGRGSQRTNTNPNGPVEQVLESRSVDPQHDHRVETPRSNQPQLDLPRVPPENSHIRNDHQHNLNNHNHSLHHQNKYLPRGHDLHSADTSNIGGLGRQGGQPNDHGPPVAPLGAVGARQSSRERSRAAQLQHQQHPQNTSMMEQAGERDIHLSRNVDRDGRGAQDHFDHLMRRDERGPAPRDHPGHLMRRDERGPAPRSPGVHSFGASANTNSMASSALHHLPRNANVHQDHGSRDFPQTMEERRRETIAEVDRRSLPDSQHELDSITLPEDTVDKIRTKVRTFVALGQISAENAQETFKMLLDEIRKKRLEEQRRFLQRAEANPATGGGPPSADLSRTPLDRHEELRGVREQLHQREPHPRHPMNQHVERSPGSINNGAPRRTQPRPSMMRGIGMEDPGLMRNNGSFPLCARGLATGLSPRRRESAARRYISDARLPARTREQEVMLENSRVRGIPFQEPPLASAVNNTRPQEPELSSGQYLRRQQQHAPQREKEPSHLVNHQGSAPQATNQQAEQAAAVDPQSKQHIEKLLQETRAKLTHLKREEAKIKEEKEREERQTAREARNMSAAPSRGGRDRDPHRSRDTRGVSRARAQSSARSYRGSYR